MTDSLKAGDIAIVLPNPTPTPENQSLEKYNGEEVVLERWMSEGPSAGTWKVRPADGFYFYCTPLLLRKKRPPPQTDGWAGIERMTGWHPNKVTA